MRISWVLLSAFCALPLCAQFHDLATDDTGSRVWFSSPLRLRGTDQHLRDKLFAADSEGRVTLVAQRPFDNRYHLLDQPEVSGDGSTLAYRAGFYCSPGTTCRVSENSRGVIAVSGAPETEVGGQIHLSRNGRYVLRHSYEYFGPAGQVELIDRQTGARRQIPVANFQFLGGPRQVASNGSALLYSSGLWLVRFDGGFQPVPTGSFGPPDFPSPWFARALRATMNDDGSLVVFETTIGAPALEIARPGDSASLRTLVSAEEGCTNPVMSADGKQVLFLSPANWSGNNTGRLQQAWIVGTDTGTIRQVTSDPAGIAEATLSGDGRVAWAVTFAGRLLRIDAESGSAREIIPRTTMLEQPALDFPLRAAPGSLVRLTGRGLASQYVASGLPLSGELSGVRVLAGGTPLPLLFVSPAEIVFQAPWELRGTMDLALAPAQSPFEEQVSRRLQVVGAAPEFLRTPDGRLAIAHGDFRGLVTFADPAQPGEVLHLYLTGLGPVDPPVPTGAPAPVSPLSVLSGRLYAFWGGSLPANLERPEVLFAGLAPGMVGIYQLSIRVPEHAPPELGVSIQMEGGSGAVASFRVSF